MKRENSVLSELFYWLFRAYVSFFHNRIFYRNVYVDGVERVPDEGMPVMIVSNHQNCMNDPLCIVFSLRNRKPYFIARADVFENPVAGAFLRLIGLLPAFRLNYEGEAQLNRNNETFQIAGKHLMDGHTVIIYPEAGHQDKRWLGTFSLGYVKLAFEAAERDGFSKEVYIMPSCNHYSNYNGMQTDNLIKYGEPIALSPYYELFKTKPRTAQRQVNEIVRQQIKSLMLDIEDLDNYEAIDYLRNTYGREFAQDNGLNPDVLPEKLESDKMFIKKMAEFKSRDEDTFAKVCENALDLKRSTLEGGFRDWNFEKHFSWVEVILKVIGYVLWLPFLILQLPNVLIYLFQKPIVKKVEKSDKMFTNSINFGTGILLTIPIVYVLSFISILVFTKNICFSLIYLFILPFLGLFSFRIYKSFVKLMGELRFKRLSGKGSFRSLINLRQVLFSVLDKEMGK